MKQKLYFPLFFLLLFTQLPLFGSESVDSRINLEDQPMLQVMIPLNRAQLEDQLGRKLNFKERIGLSLLKTGIKNQNHTRVKDTAASGGMNGFAIAGFVLGITSLLVAGIALGTVAIVFSAIAMGQIKKKGEKGRGLAIAGLILGIIGVIGAVVFLATA